MTGAGPGHKPLLAGAAVALALALSARLWSLYRPANSGAARTVEAVQSSTFDRLAARLSDISGPRLFQTLTALQTGRKPSAAEVGARASALLASAGLEAATSLPLAVLWPGAGSGFNERLYGGLAWCHLLERVSGRGRPPLSRVLEVLPGELRPGLVPPGTNRRVEVDLRGRGALVRTGESNAPADSTNLLKLTAELPDLSHVDECCLLLRAAPVDVSTCVWLRVNGEARVALMTARGRQSGILCHTVPPGLLMKGTNRFEASVDSAVDAACAVTELESFEIVLYP